MSKIVYIMGKSATGKDSIYKEMIQRLSELKEIIPYTTRPQRHGEKEGIAYHFVSEEQLESQTEQGKVIECRTYDTAHGPWHYFTVDDEQFAGGQDAITIGTLESYMALKEYFGKQQMIPVYVEVEDGERLARALKRERKQDGPKYVEMCRRFIADDMDFSAEKLAQAEIEKVFENIDRDVCLEEIENYIKEYIK